MAINSYEELMEIVNARRDGQLCLEIDLGSEYSVEHEDAKAELQKAEVLKNLTGSDTQFLSDNLETLRERVEATRPTPNVVYARFSRIGDKELSVLRKEGNRTPYQQYEFVLQKVFLGLFNGPDDDASLLGDNPNLVSTEPGMGSVLQGSAVQNVVQAFMNWQNNGGEVNISPTKSGRD